MKTFSRRFEFPAVGWIAAIMCFLATSLYAAQQLYTCGMHPQIIKTAPGNCPICGMKLTPVRSNTAGAPSGERKIKYYKSSMTPGEVSPKPGKDSMGMDLVPVYEADDSSAQTIRIDAVTIQRMNLQTALVERGPVRRELRTVGTVAYDEQTLRDITTKYEGWIEKLPVNTTWAIVKAGDPLFEIYSPDLYNAQLNYLVALRSEGEAGGPFTRAALSRLQLLDLPADVIAEVTRTGEARRTFVFRAPSDGIVIEKMVVVGQMMKPGEKIFRLADLSTVWVLAQIFEKDLALVREGQAAVVRTTYGSARTFEGKVERVLPQVEEQTRAATVRIVLPNADRFLRPGMFTDVRFTAQGADSAVLVPDVAVLRSGERNTVFIAKDGGSFEPREVQLGARSEGNFYEVLSGLEVGDRVVTSGQFMLDSESQLREAIQKMIKPTEPVKTGLNETPSAKRTPLSVLAFAMTDATTSLAADNLDGYRKQLPALRTVLAAYFGAEAHAAHGPLGKFKEGPPDGADLKTARVGFVAFSTAVSDLARAAHLHHTDGFRIFECTMAPGGTARWLQRAAAVKNPFLGAAMSECGTEIDARTTSITAPAPHREMSAMLPPGHPPLDGATLAAFAATNPSTVATATDSCGSCGMSQAAMAAGEPCEQEKK